LTNIWSASFIPNKISSWKLTEELLENPEIMETIDSFIFRFTKMQDTMGQKLFPLVLEALEEDVKNKLRITAKVSTCFHEIPHLEQQPGFGIFL
jgi:hypothetical protein